VRGNDNNLEARILSRLEDRREREQAHLQAEVGGGGGMAGGVGGGSAPQSSHAVGDDEVVEEHASDVQGSVSEGWARARARREPRETPGDDTMAHVYYGGDDTQSVQQPARVGVARGASGGAAGSEGGRGAGAGTGQCREGFSAQLAAIVADVQDAVSWVRSSHEAAALRSLSDDQLMAAAAAHADPLAPPVWEVPEEDSFRESWTSEASPRRRAARPFRHTFSKVLSIVTFIVDTLGR
jgi:hypothetical protein